MLMVGGWEGVQMLVAISDTDSPLIFHLAAAVTDLHVKATLFPTLQHLPAYFACERFHNMNFTRFDQLSRHQPIIDLFEHFWGERSNDYK